MTTNLNLYQINTTAFEEENFLLLTSLTEKQIIKVIKPIVDDERENDILYDNDDLVWSLKEAYPKQVVEMYTSDFDTISI